MNRLPLITAALLLASCGSNNVKPTPPPNITVVVPVACNEQTTPAIKLDPVEFTLVDGRDVVTGKQDRWVALTLDGWATLLQNENRVLERTQSLEAVISYYRSCIKAAQSVKPTVKSAEEAK